MYPPPWWPSKWKLFQGEGIFVWAPILTIYIDWCWLMIRKFKTKRKYQICRMAGVNVIEWPNVLVELKENRKRLTRTKVGINYGIKRHIYIQYMIQYKHDIIFYIGYLVQMAHTLKALTVVLLWTICSKKNVHGLLEVKHYATIEYKYLDLLYDRIKSW